jgi:hypothetical protein
MTAPIHAIPSPAQEKAAADLASLPVEMMSRTTTNMFSMQTSFLLYGWLQSMQAGKAMADAIAARSEAPKKR